MAEAFKCDRCDELYGGNPHTILSVENSTDKVPVMGDNQMVEGRRELCQECTKEIIAWFGEYDG